ncbi:hypothetical protein BC939DRAFT_133711 [Gamsiella multidivaricata]|uniref:uncharacterized protein n=1 Tax=Gamsiella multidivaricata TaxID=101098 RepID=UPI00221F63BD|nr:uncharacterized protein BC939DRAFT_133711 [Gamsiella multidivaricata]KAI7825240.1 hypothetical protein BC939DRAFT_133711 [Gamsiella multidivaricata]
MMRAKKEKPPKRNKETAWRLRSGTPLDQLGLDALPLSFKQNNKIQKTCWKSWVGGERMSEWVESRQANMKSDKTHAAQSQPFPERAVDGTLQLLPPLMFLFPRYAHVVLQPRHRTLFVLFIWVEWTAATPVAVAEGALCQPGPMGDTIKKPMN